MGETKIRDKNCKNALECGKNQHFSTHLEGLQVLPGLVAGFLYFRNLSSVYIVFVLQKQQLVRKGALGALMMLISEDDYRFKIIYQDNSKLYEGISLLLRACVFDWQGEVSSTLFLLYHLCFGYFRFANFLGFQWFNCILGFYLVLLSLSWFNLIFK